MSTSIEWEHPASLMRVTTFSTADDQEELVARGTVYELVGSVVEMSADEQDRLLIRASGPDWTREWDADAIRELAARPEFTGAAGAFDTAEAPGDLLPGAGAAPSSATGPVGGRLWPQNFNNDPS